MSEQGWSYRQAGVDLDAAARAKDRLKTLVARTRDAHTLSELGQFGGLYEVPAGMDSPVLVASADGVGTKLKVAFLAGRHGTVGRDLVHHCVNDILVQGARPLFFLDYLATGRLDEGVVEEVVGGVAAACAESGCALLGGETAQMPDFYADDEYDLAGFIVGVLDRARLIDGRAVQAGDVLLGLASNGLHTNGYTLARRIVFDHMGLRIDDAFPELDRPVGDVLLDVHRSYLPVLRGILDSGIVHALAHITGGGIPGNLPRVLPDGIGARVERSSWTPPLVFRVLERAGGVEKEEMYRVFNMGVGMIVIVGRDRVDEARALLTEAGESAWVLGHIEAGEGVRWDD